MSGSAMLYCGPVLFSQAPPGPMFSYILSGLRNSIWQRQKENIFITIIINFSEMLESPKVPGKSLPRYEEGGADGGEQTLVSPRSTGRSYF